MAKEGKVVSPAWKLGDLYRFLGRRNLRYPKIPMLGDVFDEIKMLFFGDFDLEGGVTTGVEADDLRGSLNDDIVMEVGRFQALV